MVPGTDELSREKAMAHQLESSKGQAWAHEQARVSAEQLDLGTTDSAKVDDLEVSLGAETAGPLKEMGLVHPLGPSSAL